MLKAKCVLYPYMPTVQIKEEHSSFWGEDNYHFNAGVPLPVQICL